MTTLAIRKPTQTVLDFIHIGLAACLIALCAQIKIPLWFTPVPLGIQTLSGMLIAAFLGSRKGSLAAVVYLCLGGVGLPVWAGGAAGFAHFMGPTGGYCLGYVAQIYSIGWLLERQSSPSFSKILAVLVLSVFLQLSMGSLWLGQFVGFKRCFALGFAPFVVTDLAKALVAAGYIKKSRQ